MQTIWTFNFTSSIRFVKAEYIFEFENEKYRLVRGTSEESDKLITVTSDSSPKTTDQCIERTLRLFDYLSWYLKTGIQYLNCVGQGVYSESNCLLEKTFVSSFYDRNLRSYLVDLSFIPDVKNDIQEFALTLWNEAECSNSSFLSFINYWKIVELTPNKKIKGDRAHRAIKWINSLPTNRIYGLGELKNDLPTKYLFNGEIGDFLYNQCRNAIAHVSREPTLRRNRIDSINKISKPKIVMEAIATYYIENELNLGHYRKSLNVSKTKKRTRALKHLKDLNKTIKSNTPKTS